MTLENNERLLKHYKATDQKERAVEMERHIADKIILIKANMNNPKSVYYKFKDDPRFIDVVAKPKKEKKNG